MRYLLNAKLNVNIIAVKTIINKYRVNFITMVLSKYIALHFVNLRTGKCTTTITPSIGITE